MPRTISHSFAALTREILFLPLEHKIHIFSPLCNIIYIFHIFTHCTVCQVSPLLVLHELTITLKSTWTNKQVEFKKDLRKEDRIEPVTFTADQEWYLCKHVVTESTTQHIGNVAGPNESSIRDYPLYVIKCHVKRKRGCYFWNFAMVIVRKLSMGCKHCLLKSLNYLAR